MPVNPAAALAIQVAKGILSMGWAFWSVDHVKQSHSGGPPPLTIKMSWPGVVNCQPECSQFGSIWDGLNQWKNVMSQVVCLPGFTAAMSKASPNPLCFWTKRLRRGMGGAG